MDGAGDYVVFYAADGLETAAGFSECGGGPVGEAEYSVAFLFEVLNNLQHAGNIAVTHIEPAVAEQCYGIGILRVLGLEFGYACVHILAPVHAGELFTVADIVCKVSALLFITVKYGHEQVCRIPVYKDVSVVEYDIFNHLMQ